MYERNRKEQRMKMKGQAKGCKRLTASERSPVKEESKKRKGSWERGVQTLRRGRSRPFATVRARTEVGARVAVRLARRPAWLHWRERGAKRMTWEGRRDQTVEGTVPFSFSPRAEGWHELAYLPKAASDRRVDRSCQGRSRETS